MKSSELYRAGQIAPGARLLAAVSLLEGTGGSSRTGADIGCDHGKLAVYLAQKGIAARVIAVDKRPLPLAKARGLVLQCGLAGKVECRLGDGLAALSPGEADEVVIAGLSGETVAGIIGAAAWAKGAGTHFVLVPSGRAEVLRVWLGENGFLVGRELAVCEGGRPYAALSARHTGGVKTPRGLDAELGLLQNDDGPAARQLAQNRLKDLENRLHGPLTGEERQELENTIQEVTEWLQLKRS